MAPTDRRQKNTSKNSRPGDGGSGMVCRVNATTKWKTLNSTCTPTPHKRRHINSTTEWVIRTVQLNSAQKREKLSSMSKNCKTSDCDHMLTCPPVHDEVKRLSEVSPFEKEKNKNCDTKKNEGDSDNDHIQRMGNGIEVITDNELKEPSHEKVPVQHWDHYVKDLSKCLKKKEAPGIEPSEQIKWDGNRRSKSAKVVEDLLQEKLNGFGKHVLSWEGCPSSLGEDRNECRKRDVRQSWITQYEEDLDRGKVKKIKKKHQSGVCENNINIFQTYQNMKNTEKIPNVRGPYSRS